MARREVIELIDDLDGKPTKGDGQTVQFAYLGAKYEIDLGPKNAKKLDNALAPFIAAARRTGGRKVRGSGAVPAHVDREQLAAIRAWARDNGYEVSDRGRVSREIQEAYQRAH